MKERGWIQPIVERVVGQVLDSHADQLRTEIVHRVMEEIAAAPGPAEVANSDGPSPAASADLARTVAEIQLGMSQRDILRALLDGSARYATRVALFIVKGNHASGWQARGFANSDAIKDFALSEKAPAVARAIGERVATGASEDSMDERFLKDFGKPAAGEGQIFPLILKDKVAALVYADGGTGASGPFDVGSIELLMLATGAWLEVTSLRKQTQKEPSAANIESASAPASQMSAAPAPAFNDPFAAHAPAFSAGHARAAAASAGESAPVVGPEATAVEAPVAPSAPSMSPEDQDVHNKAQRFARLLVDEIKLYNQAKVSEGRKNKDLYDRLKETIEKSRATYQKRYGNTVAGSGNYFHHEIMRSLAEDNPSIMGANFRQ
jgi:hypothetical protein